MIKKNRISLGTPDITGNDGAFGQKKEKDLAIDVRKAFEISLSLTDDHVRIMKNLTE